MAQKGYKWNYCSLGGVVRVNISTGEDLAHLGELDQKLWTVLSCPVKGLEFDQKTLELLDTDGDGKIRVAEVVNAATWLCSVIRDKDMLLKGEDELPLSQINTEDPKGQKLYNSAKQILSNLGLNKESISLSEALDTARIFAQTGANGDGVITPISSSDEDLKALINLIASKIGSVADRSGELGISGAQIESFYSELADYAAWKDAAEAEKEKIFPYGDNTAAALSACLAVKDKFADYFMRCKLIAFDADVAGVVDMSADRLSAISAKNLASELEEISTYPIARPRKDGILPFEGINPAWQSAFNAVKSLVIDKDIKDGISEEEWSAILAKFDAYSAWMASKKGLAVEGLGIDEVKALLKADRKADLLALVEADLALKEEADSIDEVSKLLRYYKYFYKLVKNYVFFHDFYSLEDNSIFNAGELYIDQRCCHLCVRVEDMAAHAQMAALSGMFLIYCTCTSKNKNKTMNIVAAMTDGETKRLRAGKNAVFYDREGEGWDAVVTKIVDNPISIKKAFLSPYVKFADTITERINKSAAEKESKALADISKSANSINIPKTEEEKNAAVAAMPKPGFDIAKFAGIFAAIGMAVAYLTTALAKMVDPWYNVLIVLGLLVVCVSGPSMFLAWQKIRKRNLEPILNANGWAINSVILVNSYFGRTLTTVADYPILKLDDPFRKKTPLWKKILRIFILVLVLLAIAFAVLHFTGKLDSIGIKL